MNELLPNNFSLLGLLQIPYVAIVEGDDLASKIAEVEEKLTSFYQTINMGSSVEGIWSETKDSCKL